VKIGIKKKTISGLPSSCDFLFYSYFNDQPDFGCILAETRSWFIFDK
jgi:hypothetical protein